MRNSKEINPPPILILSPRHSPDSLLLWGAAVKRGWSVERLASWRIPKGWNHAKETTLYGEPLFCETVAEQLGRALVVPPLDWLALAPGHLVRREVRFATLGEARNLSQPRFLKPADACKLFAAGVYASGDALPGEDILPAETPVLIAEPVRWEAEYRFFVCESGILTGSLYAREGDLANFAAPQDPEEKAQAENFARRVLRETEEALPPSVALDVGIIAERGWAVVELNPTYSSGLYGANPEMALDAIARACV
jgi:hypothetical protein